MLTQVEVTLRGSTYTVSLLPIRGGDWSVEAIEPCPPTEAAERMVVWDALQKAEEERRASWVEAAREVW